jgi:hypothetical protein
MSALLRTLEQYARATLVCLTASLSHRPCHHTGAWDEKSVGGDGASLITDGIVTSLGRLDPALTELGVESDQRQ